MGDEITATSQRIVGSSRGDHLEEVNAMLRSQPFRMLERVVQDCSAQITSLSSADAEGEREPSSSNTKKSKKPEAPTKSAPTSFSLFDMMDAQKGAFVVPPRITANHVIEAYKREMREFRGKEDVTTMQADRNEFFERDINDSSSLDNLNSLELLEKAGDMEDLSPDPDTWEEIRQILYFGLISPDSNVGSNADRQSRFLEVHESLHCRFRRDNGGMMYNPQLWDLAQNLVGFILSFSQQFPNGDDASDVGVAVSRQTLNLYWDAMHSFLDVLSRLALGYITSSVGNEREIERMVMGMSLILTSDFDASILAAMEPMAGWFEVWCRFIRPNKLVTIVQATGLGGAVLSRCNSLGSNLSSRKIVEMLDNSVGDSPSLVDVQHCNFLQSLSVLRTILFHCGGSPAIVSTIHRQSVSTTSDSAGGSSAQSFFLKPSGVASTDDVQAFLRQQEEQTTPKKDPTAVACVMKPFHDVLAVKEENGDTVDCALENLCEQAISLFQD